MRSAVLLALLLGACAQQRAMNTCDALGVPRGTPVYVDCYNAQMDRQQRAFEVMQRQNWMQQQQALQFHPIQMPTSRAWSATCNRIGTFTYCNGN